MVIACLGILVFPDLFQLAVRRCFYPDLIQLVQAYERKWISENTAKTTMDHLLQIETSLSTDQTPGFGTTPIQASIQLLDFANKTTGYAFSVDPITVEAEKRRLKSGSARLAPLLQIVDEDYQDPQDL